MQVSIGFMNTCPHKSTHTQKICIHITETSVHSIMYLAPTAINRLQESDHTAWGGDGASSVRRRTVHRASRNSKASSVFVMALAWDGHRCLLPLSVSTAYFPCLSPLLTSLVCLRCLLPLSVSAAYFPCQSPLHCLLPLSVSTAYFPCQSPLHCLLPLSVSPPLLTSLVCPRYLLPRSVSVDYFPCQSQLLTSLPVSAAYFPCQCPLLASLVNLRCFYFPRLCPLLTSLVCLRCLLPLSVSAAYFPCQSMQDRGVTMFVSL